MQREIIYITESSGYGGAETYLLDLASAAIDSSRVSVALPFRDSNAKLREELHERSIHVIELQQYRAIYVWNFFIALKFFLRHKTGLFHFTLPHPDSCRWLLLAASLLRRRYYITELLVPPDPYRAGWYFFVTHLLFNGLKRLSYNRSAGVIAICEEMKDILVRKYNLPAEKINVIYNGIEAEDSGSEPGWGDALREELQLGEGNLLLITAGRLMEQKGHRFLISALEKLLVEFPAIVLLIMGEGPLLGPLKEEARNKGLDDHVRFTGFRKDFRSLLHMSDIFVLPSLNEGFPYIIIEAMFAGLPIVASAVGGIPEAVSQGETGLLVRPKDVDQLYRAIRELLIDGAMRERMAQKGREKAEQHFSKATMLREIFSLYEGVR